jgi:hypothetical protein
MFFGELQSNEYGEKGRGGRAGGIIDTISKGLSESFSFVKDKFLELIGIDQSEDALPLYQQFLNKIGLEDSEVAGKSLFVQIMEKLFPPNEANEPLGTRIGNAVIDGITSFFEGSAGEAMISTISYYFEGLMLNLQEAIDSKLGILSNERLARERREFEERGLREGRIDPAQATAMQAYAEDLARIAQGSFNSIVGEKKWWQSEDDYANEISQFESSPMRQAQLEEMARVDALLNPPQRRVGTLKATGKMTEPADTVAKIHQGERVLNPSEAGAVNDLPGAINQLNTLTAQIRDLMAQSVQHQEKTARGIRKLGSDMMA